MICVPISKVLPMGMSNHPNLEIFRTLSKIWRIRIFFQNSRVHVGKNPCGSENYTTRRTCFLQYTLRPIWIRSLPVNGLQVGGSQGRGAGNSKGMPIPSDIILAMSNPLFSGEKKTDGYSFHFGNLDTWLKTGCLINHFIFLTQIRT